MEEIQERLARAFEAMFAANVPWFGGGGPGYYGVRLENVAADGSEVDLVITFRAGVRYCCFESGCHFSYFDYRGWARLRRCLDREGLSYLPLPIVKKFRSVIESGAVMSPGRTNPESVNDKEFEYEVGALHPIVAEPKSGD